MGEEGRVREGGREGCCEILDLISEGVQEREKKLD